MNFIIEDIDKTKIKNYKEICLKMKELTENLKKNIEEIENIELEKKEKEEKEQKKHLKPQLEPAGRRGSVMDKNTLNWKQTLRSHWL